MREGENVSNQYKFTVLTSLFRDCINIFLICYLFCRPIVAPMLLSGKEEVYSNFWCGQLPNVSCLLVPPPSTLSLLHSPFPLPFSFPLSLTHFRLPLPSLSLHPLSTPPSSLSLISSTPFIPTGILQAYTGLLAHLTS